jgi:hypothetical protein
MSGSYIRHDIQVELIAAKDASLDISIQRITNPVHRPLVVTAYPE